jgi:hypothetical protein
MEIEKKDLGWVVLGILVIIFLIAAINYMTEKDVDRCISSGVSEEVCNELRNW